MKTQLMQLARERVAENRDSMLAELIAYSETDLLYYRVKEPKLAARQAQHFDPILAAVQEAYGVTFELTDGFMPVAQPEASLARLKTLFDTATDKELTALYAMTPLLGSALLALAVWKKLVTLEAALAAAHLDEAFQAGQWGEDAEANARIDSKEEDIRQCVFFLDS